ncbi:uncharacterized protein LOC143904533 [Temnothorax americanus]|uniref:uncharacterized protein LOC143904533 n=1 Tax=Temnothorax americanus TaxID=1964332 RepID=UPI00406938B2
MAKRKKMYIFSKAETSQTIVPIIVSDVEITQPSTSTIKKPAVRTKSSDVSPRKRKLREKFQKLKAQNKVMRETIRRLRMEKKKKATKVEEENEFDQLIKLGRKLLPEKFNRILAAQIDPQNVSVAEDMIPNLRNLLYHYFF